MSSGYALIPIMGDMGDEFVTIDEYIEHSRMDHNYAWGTHNEMLVLAHMAGLNIASYNIIEHQYHFHNPGMIGINAYPDDNSRPTIYITYTGDHFKLVQSQD